MIHPSCRFGPLRWGLLVMAGLSLQAGHGFAQAPPSASVAPAPSFGRQAFGLVTTHAEAKRRLPNTVSDAVVSIEVHGRDLRSTASALGRQSQALLTFLRGQPTERLRTDGMSFDAEIQELRGQPDRIKGYTGRLSVSFRTTPEQLSMLLAGCLDNGATGLGQFGSSPREQEIEAARQEMVTEASQAALTQARAIAVTTGQRIAGVELVEVDPTSGLGAVPVMSPYMAERAARPAPPVRPVATEAGESGASVMVVMTLRLAPPD
jgi:uncharacterized protein YggE